VYVRGFAKKSPEKMRRGRERKKKRQFLKFTKNGHKNNSSSFFLIHPVSPQLEKMLVSNSSSDKIKSKGAYALVILHGVAASFAFGIPLPTLNTFVTGMIFECFYIILYCFALF
jgi:hypothetical protein